MVPMTTTLSDRECEILTELALNGGTDAEIGERLGISRNTVRTYVQRLHAKTGTHTKLELAALVWRTQGMGRGLLPGAST
jgi:DNA-binding CsgD family transcriptional regulator